VALVAQGQVACNHRGIALGIVEAGIVTHLPQAQHRLLGDVLGCVAIGARRSGRLQRQLPKPCCLVLKCVYRHQSNIVYTIITRNGHFFKQKPASFFLIGIFGTFRIRVSALFGLILADRMALFLLYLLFSFYGLA
jgi:hypothetical protein